MTLTPTILKKRKPDRLDPVWYTGEILEVNYKGYRFYAWENDWFEISATDKNGDFCDLMESVGSWDEAYDYLSDEDTLDELVDRLMSEAERKRIAKGGVIKQ